MTKQLSVHLKMFNDKVKVMNQTKSKTLTLSAQEARNIHADIFDLLNSEVKKTNSDKTTDEITEISFDGGNF